MLHGFLGLAQFLLCWLWSFFYDGFWLFSSLLCTIPTLLPLLFILVPQKVVLSLFKLFSRSSLATLLPGFRAQISEFVWNVKLLSLLHFQIVYKFVFAMYLLCSPHTYFKSNNRSIGNQKDSFLALSSKLIVLLALFRIDIITDCFDFIFPSSLLVGFPLLLQLRLSKGIMSAIFHVPKHVPYEYIQIWLYYLSALVAWKSSKFSLSPVLFSHTIISLPFFHFLLFTFLGMAQLPSWKILRGENQLLHHLRAKGILFSPGLSWDTENSSLISHYLYASLRRGVRFW